MTTGIAIAAGLGMAVLVADLCRRPVPEWLTVAGVAGGMACAAWNGPHGIGIAAAGASLGFLILVPLRRCGAVGGAENKLMAAYGALLGPTGILLAAVFAGAIGALSAAGKLLLNPRTAAIPYARAIVLGAWVSLLGGGL